MENLMFHRQLSLELVFIVVSSQTTNGIMYLLRRIALN